jgi:hypothetical protein
MRLGLAARISNIGLTRLLRKPIGAPQHVTILQVLVAEKALEDQRSGPEDSDSCQAGPKCYG